MANASKVAANVVPRSADSAIFVNKAGWIDA